MNTTLKEVTDLAECFTGCAVISHNRFSCIISAPDADQADGVVTVLKRNGISAFTRKNPFTNAYTVGVCFV